MLVERLFMRRPSADLGSVLRYIVELAVVGAVYVVVAKLSLTLASIHPNATPIWRTTSYALAAAMLLGYRISPAIFIGAVIANATTAGSIYTSLGIATGNTLESLIGAYLIDRWSDGRNTFNTPSGVARFALICFAPTMISATFGVGSLSLGGYSEWSEYGSVWTTWWIGDLAGALVITPALVLWGYKFGQPIERGDIIRSGWIVAASISVGLVAFSPLLEQTPARTPLAFLSILPLMWAALRRNQADTAASAFLLSSFAVWGTMTGHGPFALGDLNESFLLLLAFMISVSVPSLALSAEVAVRKRHEEHVNFVLLELSHRSKNLLSIVQSMASQIGRRTDTFQNFFSGFSTRLRALADTHELLVKGNWEGADVHDIVRVQLAPFHNVAECKISCEGPRLELKPKAAEQIGLALHELGTNAAKHGALSVPSGLVNLRWGLESDGGQDGHFRFTWKELGGPLVAQPLRQGFGNLVLTKTVPTSLGGTALIEFEPEGIKWVLLAPSTDVLADEFQSATVRDLVLKPHS